MKTHNFTEKVFFKCTPQEIYDALMDSKKHAMFTDDEAKVSDQVGGEFSVYGDSIFGKNLELIPGKKIVQTWLCETETWPVGYFSKVTFEFAPVNGGTELTFTHEGIPESELQDIKEGWSTYYWQPLKKMLEK